MKLLRALPLILACCLAAPAGAVPGGKLETLALGTWFCELPGDAVTQPVARPDETFTAVPDSSYQTPDGQRGSYLLLGSELAMTSGPREGDRFRVESEAMVRRLAANGAETPLRCVRAGDPAAMAMVPSKADDQRP